MRKWVLVVALVCGGFGIGVSEFIVMGLLPQIASDLVAPLYAENRDVALAATGGLATAYALGVVVGMVLTPAVLRRRSERSALLVCSGLMFTCTLLTAVAPTLSIAIVLRFFSALTHASYIGVGAMAIAHLFGSRKYGMGSAIVHGGLAGSNLLGVPVLTALGQHIDWRIILGGAALLFAAPFVSLIVVGLPTVSTYDAGERAQGAARFPARLWIVVTSAVLISAAGFAVVTYVAPALRWSEAPPGGLAIAWAMFAFGVGMNLGNIGAGILADRAAVLAVWLSAGAGLAGALLLIAPGRPAAVIIIGFLLIGIPLGGVSPATQVLFLRDLRHMPRLASSMPSGTGNLGSAVGTVVGATLLAGIGPAALPIGALALGLVGVALFWTQRLFRPATQGAE